MPLVVTLLIHFVEVQYRLPKTQEWKTQSNWVAIVTTADNLSIFGIVAGFTTSKPWRICNLNEDISGLVGSIAGVMMPCYLMSQRSLTRYGFEEPDDR